MVRVKESESRDIVRRLKSVQGHLCGIEKMMLECQDCEEILHQMIAVRTAVDKLTAKMGEYCLLNCLLSAIKEGEAPDEACCKAIRLITLSG